MPNDHHSELTENIVWGGQPFTDPDDIDSEPAPAPKTFMSTCIHCHERSVPVKHNEDGELGLRRCNNCGPLECSHCECTLHKRSTETNSTGFELYCRACEEQERWDRRREQEEEERLCDWPPRRTMRFGKTERDRENRAIRERAKRTWKPSRSLEFSVRANSMIGTSIAITLHITEIRLGCAGNCEIRYHATTVSPGLQTLSANPSGEQSAIISSETKTIPISFWRFMNKSGSFEHFTIKVNRYPEIKAALRDLKYLTRETRRTLGRLSGSERREEERLRATPTREPQNQDEERPRHRGHRCGKKRTPWTLFRKERASNIEAYYTEEFVPRPQTPRELSDLERENAARHIELPAYERKGSRSSRMTVSRSWAYGVRHASLSLAFLESRTLKVHDDEPMHLLGSIPTKGKPLKSCFGRQLLHSLRSR